MKESIDPAFDSEMFEEFADMLRMNYGFDISDYDIESYTIGKMDSHGAEPRIIFNGVTSDRGFTRLLGDVLLVQKIEEAAKNNPVVEDLYSQLLTTIELTK